MWKILSNSHKIAFALFVGAFVNADAKAQQTTNVNNNNNQNYGFNLPTPVNPHGFDEVRASDGTTCRSSISGGGPYLDIGGLSGQDYTGRSSGSTMYGRIVIPLGEKPDRLNCGSLYQLEIERLRHELRLARTGVTGGFGNTDAVTTGSVSGDGNTRFNNNAPLAITVPEKPRQRSNWIKQGWKRKNVNTQ